jgi:hypothetical protein
MSRLHFGLYLALGITFLLLNVWRFSHGRTGATVRLTSLLIGIAILAILAASLLGIVSLEGVEECLNQKVGHRSRFFACLLEIRHASP